MTYLNHAGTSWPKPQPVLEANARLYESDPRNWPEHFAAAHTTVAEFFGVATDRLLLTPSCTTALSLAILDLPWRTGDRVICSGFEHHALQRNLVKLEERGVEVEILPSTDDLLIDLRQLERGLRKGVRLVAMTAACNVTGDLLPIEEVIQLAHQYDTPVLVDGAQVAGWWDIDLKAWGVDLFTFAGHKGTQAPWGVGGLYVADHLNMAAPEAACDVSNKEKATQCAAMPGYCDSGSVNVAALVGLAAACKWLARPDQSDRLLRARRLAAQLCRELTAIPGLTLHGEADYAKKMPTVACSLEGCPSTQLANHLRQRGVISSGGFQCSPQAHRRLGTASEGVVRFSFGPNSVEADVERASDLFREVVSAQME